ncbi:MAG: recombinase family protein [Armatimonadota bacterium]
MPCATFLYTRRSSEDDDRQVLSLDAQEKECRAFADRHATPITELIRESHSARRPGRPLFEAMLKQAEKLLRQGTAVRILSHKPDRLLRNIADWARLNELIDAGLELLFVTGSYENNAQGKMIFGINVVFAKYYVDNLSEEVRKGLREKLARGEWPGWAPLGYLNVKDPTAPRRIIIDPVLGPLIIQAFELFATGEYSLATLTRKMAEAGLVGRLTGKLLTKSILRDRILTNPFYCGFLRFKGELHPASHEPLISVALFEKVQEVLAGRSRPRRQTHDFRFGGLFVCRECGCAVVGDLKKRKYIYYRCSRRRGDCQEPYVPEARFLALIAAALDGRLQLRPELAVSLREAAEVLHAERRRGDDGLAALKRRQQEVRSRLMVLLDLRLGGHLTDEQYLAKKEALMLDEAKVAEQVQRSELDPGDPREAVEWFISTCNTLPELLAQAEPSEARELLRMVGSNYRYGGGKVDFEPVEPFTIAAQSRHLPDLEVSRASLEAIRRASPPPAPSIAPRPVESALGRTW